MARVLLSIAYATIRTMRGLVVLRARGAAAKDVELLVLRHEVACPVPEPVVAAPRLRPVVHAARWYSLMSPPSTGRLWMAAARSTTRTGWSLGACCCRPWCGRCSL